MTTRTAAQDTILRLALGILIADRVSALTDVQRDWLVNRLLEVDANGQHTAFNNEERLQLRPLLLAYIREHRPGILPIVARQFEDIDTFYIPL